MAQNLKGVRFCLTSTENNVSIQTCNPLHYHVMHILEMIYNHLTIVPMSPRPPSPHKLARIEVRQGKKTTLKSWCTVF